MPEAKEEDKLEIPPVNKTMTKTDGMKYSKRKDVLGYFLTKYPLCKA